MNAKYEFTGETKNHLGVTLKQIRLLVDIAALGLAAGTVGGWIEKEDNLSVSGNAWVSDNARVYGNAWVSGDAQVSGNAQVFGNAWVSDNARVYGNAQVFGNAWVSDNAQVKTVNVTATRTDGYTFLVAPTPDGPRIIAGCRYFTFKEAKAHWKETRGGTKLGDETMSIIRHLETMAKLNGFMEPVTDEVQS